MIPMFLKNERGTAAVEFALIAGVLVLAIVTGLVEVGFLTEKLLAGEEMRAAMGGR